MLRRARDEREQALVLERLLDEVEGAASIGIVIPCLAASVSTRAVARCASPFASQGRRTGARSCTSFLARWMMAPARSACALQFSSAASSAVTADHGRMTDTVSISERPALVEDRAVPGHWEGDLLFGRDNSQIATLVERQTRYVMLAKVEAKDIETVINALIKHAHSLPRELYQSLTWDRGVEMAEHKRCTLAADIKVDFCDPQNPWQRGSNENTDGLLRQYFPKGTDLSVHSQAHLDAIARRLNERPRKTLNFEKPAERFAQCVASIG